MSSFLPGFTRRHAFSDLFARGPRRAVGFKRRRRLTEFSREFRGVAQANVERTPRGVDRAREDTCPRDVQHLELLN
jgi:hypothetical protein